MTTTKQKQTNLWRIATFVLLALILGLLVVDYNQRKEERQNEPAKQNLGGVSIDEESFAKLVTAMGGIDSVTTFQLCDVKAKVCAILSKKP